MEIVVYLMMGTPVSTRIMLTHWNLNKRNA